ERRPRQNIDHTFRRAVDDNRGPAVDLAHTPSPNPHKLVPCRFRLLTQPVIHDGGPIILQIGKRHVSRTLPSSAQEPEQRQKAHTATERQLRRQHLPLWEDRLHATAGHYSGGFGINAPEVAIGPIGRLANTSRHWFRSRPCDQHRTVAYLLNCYPSLEAVFL